MVITQSRSKRTVGGARYHAFRKKRLFEKGSEPTLTRIGKLSMRITRGKAGYTRSKILLSDIANIYDPSSKKYAKATIKAVVENTASRHFVRRNIITKGAVINTDLGKARVTSRPGQDGTINAVLI